MKRKLHMICSYLDDAEYHQFALWVKARGVGDSGYIREQLSFDVKSRGAPQGVPKKRKVGRPKKGTSERGMKPTKPLFDFD